MDVDDHTFGCYQRPGLLGYDGAVPGLGGVEVLDLDGETPGSLRFAPLQGRGVWLWRCEADLGKHLSHVPVVAVFGDQPFGVERADGRTAYPPRAPGCGLAADRPVVRAA